MRNVWENFYFLFNFPALVDILKTKKHNDVSNSKVCYFYTSHFDEKRLSHSIGFEYALAYITLRIGFRGVKSQLNFIAELVAWDQEERKATEFELNNQKYNWSTYKQSVIKWSNMSDLKAGNIWWTNKR